MSVLKSCKYAFASVIACLLFAQNSVSSAGLRQFTYGSSSGSSPSQPASFRINRDNGNYLNHITEDGVLTWSLQSLPLKVYIEPGHDLPGYRPEFPAVLRNSFNQWIASSHNKLARVEVNNPAAANVICSFTSDTPELAEGTEAGRTKTHVRFNTENNQGEIYKVTMTLAVQLPDRMLSDEEIQKTLFHEVGHALGLVGHSPEKSDIMHAKVSNSQTPGLTNRGSQSNSI